MRAHFGFGFFFVPMKFVRVSWSKFRIFGKKSFCPGFFFLMGPLCEKEDHWLSTDSKPVLSKTFPLVRFQVSITMTFLCQIEVYFFYYDFGENDGKSFSSKRKIFSYIMGCLKGRLKIKVSYYGLRFFENLSNGNLPHKIRFYRKQTEKHRK